MEIKLQIEMIMNAFLLLLLLLLCNRQNNTFKVRCMRLFLRY